MDYGIIHEKCSPYNARSNGLVEGNVRLMKQLLCKAEGQAFKKAFSAWKNVERKGKDSPNTLFFRRKLPFQNTDSQAIYLYSAHLYLRP